MLASGALLSDSSQDALYKYYLNYDALQNITKHDEKFTRIYLHEYRTVGLRMVLVTCDIG